MGVVTVVGGDLVVVKNSWNHASTPDDFTDAWGCRGRFVAGLNSMAGDGDRSTGSLDSVAGGGGCVVVGCVAEVGVDVAFPELSGLATRYACKDFFS